MNTTSAPTAKYKLKAILFATVLASGMAFLAGSVVSIALPAIQDAFDATISDIQWVVNAYLLSLSALILISGSLGDHYGRKKMFLWGIGIFTLGSFAAALAQSTPQLIAFQGLAGVGAALMIPESLAVINVCWPSEHRGRAIGLWAGLSGALAAAGPFLGGWLVQNFGWSAVFWLNVPIGLVVFAVTAKFVPESRDPEAARLDWAGTVTIAVALSALAFGLIRAPSAGWSNIYVISALSVATAGFVAFVIAEVKSRNPLVPFSMFKNRLVLGANLATLTLYFALNGVIFFLVLNLQQIQGFSPIEAGLALLPPTVLIALFSGSAGSLADRIGPRLQMIVGPATVAAGMGLLAFAGTQADYVRDFLPGLVLFGAGMAFTIAPLTKSALAVEEEHSGVASGVNNAAARVAGLLAIAVLGGVVIGFFKSSLSANLENTSLTQQEQAQVLALSGELGNLEAPQSFSSDKRAEARAAVEGAFADGFRKAMGISSALAALAAIASFFLIRDHHKAKGKPHHHRVMVHH